MLASLRARECLAAALVLAAAALLHSGTRLPPGWRRLRLAAPITLAFLLLPLLLSHESEAVQLLSATNFSWLGATAVSSGGARRWGVRTDLGMLCRICAVGKTSQLQSGVLSLLLAGLSPLHRSWRRQRAAARSAVLPLSPPCSPTWLRLPLLLAPLLAAAPFS